MSTIQEEIDLHLLIKDVPSTRGSGQSATTPADRAKIVDALLAAGYRRVPQPVVPVPKTREEQAEFAKRWDERVEEGWARNGFPSTGFPPTPLRKNKVG